MGSFFLTSKKASATLIFLVISILVVSSGVIITNQIKKSNDDNIKGTGLVLLDTEQDKSQYSDSSDDGTKLFTFGDSGGKSSSKKSSGGGGGADPPAPEIDEGVIDVPIINETVDNQNETNYTGDLNSSGSNVNNESNLSIEVQIQGQCKPGSKETNEGPGGDYCTYDDYEQCYDYRTKSTVIAYSWNLFEGYYEKERGTDYCDDGNTLQEAYLNCGLLTYTADGVRWKEKDCNDYDQESNWVYYCTGNEVRKKKYFYDYGCSNGACKFISGSWIYDTLVSQKGDSDYCSKRKEGYDNGWAYCSLCIHGDYDCDSNSECSGNLVCKGTIIIGSDGCCKEGERWDSTNNRCCECGGNLGGGSCCLDGCHYNPSDTICYYYFNYQYGCKEGNCLGDDVYRRRQVRYCSGSSSNCNGNIGWDYGDIWDWSSVYDYCSFSSEFCDGTAEGSWTSTAFSCSNTQCTSGICCDDDCGEYSFLSTNSPCGSSSEFSCQEGEGTSNPGADVFVKTKTQYCSGSSNLCTGAYGSWSDWSFYSFCTSNEYCVQGDSYCHSCGYHTHWACHENDVYYYDDCNNLEDIKDECGIPGCFNGECIISPSVCYNDTMCGQNCPIGDPWCSNDDDVWQNNITYTCHYPGQVNAYCTNSTIPNLKELCEEDSYSDNYCSDGDVYQNFTDRGCLDGACFETTTAQFIYECGEEGCSEGECVYVECYNHTMCGPDSDLDNNYVGDPWCSNDDVWQNYINYTCNYAGTGYSYCSNSTAPNLTDPCGSDYCESWGGNYCNLDDLYHERTCHDKGCSNGVCFDNTYIEEEKVEECGISEYTGNSYCYNDDVYKDYITRGCSYSRCTSSTSEKKIEDCEHGCTSGRCKIEVCNYGGCYYF